MLKKKKKMFLSVFLCFVMLFTATPVAIATDVGDSAEYAEGAEGEVAQNFGFDMSFTLYYDGTVVFADGSIANVEELEEMYDVQCPVYVWRTVFNSGNQEWYHALDMEFHTIEPMSTSCPSRPGGGPCVSPGTVLLRSHSFGPTPTHCARVRRHFGTRCQWCRHETESSWSYELISPHVFNTTATQTIVHSLSPHPISCRIRRIETRRCAICAFSASTNITYQAFWCTNPHLVIPGGFDDEVPYDEYTNMSCQWDEMSMVEFPQKYDR